MFEVHVKVVDVLAQAEQTTEVVPELKYPGKQVKVVAAAEQVAAPVAVH